MCALQNVRLCVSISGELHFFFFLTGASLPSCKCQEEQNAAAHRFTPTPFSPPLTLARTGMKLLAPTPEATIPLPPNCCATSNSRATIFLSATNTHLNVHACEILEMSCKKGTSCHIPVTRALSIQTEAKCDRLFERAQRTARCYTASFNTD